MARSRSASSATSSSGSSSESDEELQNLLSKAIADLKQDSLAEQADVISISGGKSKQSKDVPITIDSETPKASSSKLPAEIPHNDKFGQFPRKHLSRKAYLATKPQTKGSNWFELPAAPTNPSQELRTEIAALKLASSIDPKRFLKGGAKKGLGKMPEHFQLGHIVESSRAARVDLNETSTDTRKTKKRSFVDELVQSKDTTAYTKRKYAEVQAAAQSGGRGHYKKRFRGGKFAGRGGRK